VFNLNLYVSISAAYAAGALVSSVFKKPFLKFKAPELNMIMGFSAIAGVFVSMAALFFIRYYRPMLGIPPESALPALAQVILPLIIFIPSSALFYLGVNAGVKLVANEKAGEPGFIKAVAAAGAALSGIIYLLFLWRYYTNIDVLYALGILVLAATYLLFRDKTIEGRWTMLAVITAVIVYLAFNIGGFKEKADRASSRAGFGAYYIVAEKEFPTVKFIMAKKGSALYVFENGTQTYVMPDPKYAEMTKLAKGGNIIIINGGAAGLVEELEKDKGLKSAVSYEADPYTSYILEQLFKNGRAADARVEFKSGDILKDTDLRNRGFKADTVFINPRRTGNGFINKNNLEALKSGFMADGCRLVISAAGAEKETVEETVKQVFGAAVEDKGFITAVKTVGK
jgi:spermidine synthase